MKAPEALEALKNGKYLKCKGYVGMFFWLSNTVMFRCHEDNCCEWEDTPEEFLDKYNTDEFEVAF